MANRGIIRATEYDRRATNGGAEPIGRDHTGCEGRVHSAGRIFDHDGPAFVCWLELRVPAGLPAGTLIKIEYADTKPDVRKTGKGAANQFQTANQCDEVITAGAELTFRSRFNYHGFQYVRVSTMASLWILPSRTGSVLDLAIASSDGTTAA